MKKFLAVLMSVLMVVCFAMPAFAAEGEQTKLQFNEDGKFTILNISDIQDGKNLIKLTAKFIDEAVKATNPDLIVMTGDNVAGYQTLSASKTEGAIRAFMDILEPYGIPVAIVFGNHDEPSSGLTKEEQMAIYNEYSCSISVDDGEDIWGCGTYNVPVYSSIDDSKVVFNCWMFDTGSRDDIGGYDHVKQDQIDWYKAKSDELKAANGGEVVPSIAFQHIIVPEIFEALDEVSSLTPGAVVKYGKYYALPATAAAGSVMGEPPCPSGTNGGQFDAFLEQGDVIGVVSGHDHTNSFIVPYKGIDLINTPTCGFRSYGDSSRGVRVFTIDENDPANYETHIVTFTELFEGNNQIMMTYKFYNFLGEFQLFFSNLWGRIEGFFKNIFVK